MKLEEASALVLFSARKHSQINNLPNLDQACDVLDEYLQSQDVFKPKSAPIQPQESTTAGAILQSHDYAEEEQETPIMRDLSGRIIAKRVWKREG
jgi:hypothetical protein